MPDWQALVPTVGTGVGFGLVTGWAVGFLAKKVAKLVALLAALVFIGIQLAVANRLLTVNWHGVATAFDKVSSQLSSESTHTLFGLPVSGPWSLLLVNFPYAGSFAVGFLLGFRKG